MNEQDNQDQRIPVHNGTAMPMYVAGRMIPPNETMHFELWQVPEHLRPKKAEAVAEETIQDPPAEMLDQTVATIKEGLPDLTDVNLERLEELESQAEKPRSTLLAAITEEKLRRAQAKQDKDAGGEGAGGKGAGGEGAGGKGAGGEGAGGKGAGGEGQ